MQARSGAGSAMWAVLDPFDNLVFKNFFADVGPTTLGAAGRYTVLVEGSRLDAANPGSYTFNVQPVSDEAFALTLGATTTEAIEIGRASCRDRVEIAAVARAG